MEKKFLLTLDNEFIEYCRINKIDDVEKFGKELFQRAFTELKYRSYVPTTTPLPRPIPTQESLPKEKIINKVNKDLYDE